jgi:predicted regulator of Ras-like GTPase activity (Roadblock/LC7/MglB family)
MFKEALQEVVDGTEGGIAGLLMDADGITVESYTRDGAEIDIATVGMELSAVLKDITRATEQLDTGAMREVAIQADKLTTLVRAVTREYFVALALSPEGNFGKGRFLLRLAQPRLLAALE